MKALILGGRVADVAAQEFPVAAPMFWVDCPDECVAGVWTYNGAECVAPAPVPASPAVVTIRQAKLALQAALGLTDAQVDALFADASLL